MRRRDFLFVVGSAAVARPLAVRAQQAGVRRVAILTALVRGDKRALAGIKAFKAGAAHFYIGFLLGRGVTVGAMGAALHYLVDENDFLGMTVQNWMIIVAFILFIWFFAWFLTPRAK